MKISYKVTQSKLNNVAMYVSDLTNETPLHSS